MMLLWARISKIKFKVFIMIICLKNSIEINNNKIVDHKKEFYK